MFAQNIGMICFASLNLKEASDRIEHSSFFGVGVPRRASFILEMAGSILLQSIRACQWKNISQFNVSSNKAM